VSTLAKRTVTLRPSKGRVKVTQPVQLLGNVRTSRRNRSCRGKQKVAIMRFDPNGSSWPTVDVAMTNKDGSFSAVVRPAPAQTFLYRAGLKQTRKCAGALSNKVKIKVTN
jgi:hypothetical protein